MADEMTRAEFTEFMEAFEERLDRRFTSVEERLGGLDRRFTSVEERLGGLDGRFASVEERLDGLDGRFTSVEERLTHSMKVQFEETRGLIRFSLEAVDALRETTERGFAEMRAHAEEQTTLLKAAVKHVRGRVERIERKRG